MAFAEISKYKNWKKYKEDLYKDMDKETKQKILDLIFEGKKFGEISEEVGVETDSVCAVFEANIVCYHTLAKEAIWKVKI